VTLIVPAALTVNERLLWPPGATVLDQFSVVGVEGLLGVVGVLSLPHPATSIAAKVQAIAPARETIPSRRVMGA
jgi:hypothetical protein